MESDLGIGQPKQILVVESVLGDNIAGNATTGRVSSVMEKIKRDMDITMLAMTDSGRERTLGEFISLAEAAGLQALRVVPTASPISLMVLQPPSHT